MEVQTPSAARGSLPRRPMYAVSIMEMSGSAIEATSAGSANSKVGFVHEYLGVGFCILMLSLLDTAADADEMSGERRFLCAK